MAKHTRHDGHTSRNNKGALYGKEWAVQHLRKQGWSQKRVAALFGVSQAGISKFEKADRGECQNCSNPAVPGHRLCERHRELNRHAARRQVRRPGGWADTLAGIHRRRARKYAKRVAAYGITLRTDITGPELLAAVLDHGCHCSVPGCTYTAPWPWECVGKEEGFEVDHIAGIGTILNEHRDDWVRPENLRLLCPMHHKLEGERIRIDEEALNALIDLAVERDTG